MALSYSINTHAVTPVIAPTIVPAVTPLMSLGLFTVFFSRGIIRVTVSIGDCRARVSSPSEGCLTLLITVKVEAYYPSILALSDRSRVCGSILLYQLSCFHSCYWSCYCSWCHSTAFAWIVHGCRLKRQNQGNGFHWWLSGAYVFLLIGVFDFVENSQGGNLFSYYSSIERL